MKTRPKFPFSIPSVLLASALGISACSHQAADDSAMSASDPKTKLYVFECGNIDTRDVSVFSPGVNEGQRKELTDSCYLIRHAKGDLIWDAGLEDSIGETGIEVFDGVFHMYVTHPLADQLAEINVDPAEIEWIGISHFHSDHTGNANLFSNAKLIIQQEEKEAAFGPSPEKFGFAPDTYSKLNPTMFKVLNGDFDVFGDGTVVVKRAPGHTPGHQMLFVDLDETGPIVLSGDLYHFTSNREHRRVPAFNFDKQQTIESMAEMEHFTQKKNAQFWIQHDKEQNLNLKHAPLYYQ